MVARGSHFALLNPFNIENKDKNSPALLKTPVLIFGM